MSSAAERRGGAPVGLVADLDPVEAGAVRGLRAWCDGPASVRAFEDGLCQQVGKDHANAISKTLSQLCDLCFRHGRRPLMRHHANCKCLGADECCFANFIAAAADGEREDAMLLATLMVRPDFASSMIGLAEYLGAALSLASLKTQPTHTPDNVIRLQ